VFNYVEKKATLLTKVAFFSLIELMQ